MYFCFKILNGKGNPLPNSLPNLKICGIVKEDLEGRGLELIDIKVEFGLVDGKVIVIDEILTPDSSRFWDIANYKVGSNPQSFDKQFIRDYMEQTGWDKNSTPPAISPDIVKGAVAKYQEALERITKDSL